MSTSLQSMLAGYFVGILCVLAICLMAYLLQTRRYGWCKQCQQVKPQAQMVDPDRCQLCYENQHLSDYPKIIDLHLWKEEHQ